MQEMFIDYNFGRNDQAIYGPRDEKLNFDIIWLRASEIVPKGKIFGKTSSVLDIKQGKLGNCYFLSTLITISTNLELVKSFFVYKNKTLGKYTIKIPRFNEKIRIDDFIPCKASTRKPIFAKVANKKLWVMLLEKAYAKLHGNYFALSKYNPALAICDFLSLPAFRINFSINPVIVESGELWERLMTATSYKQSIILSSKMGGCDLGIPSCHSFAFISAREYQGVKLVTLKNPWMASSNKWAGAWSDSSAEWNVEAINELAPIFKKGYVWISFEDLIRYFDKYSYAVYDYPIDKTDSFIVTRDAEGARIEKLFTLKVEEESKFYIGIHQEDLRARSAEPWRYLDFGILILQQSDLTPIACTSLNTWNRDLFFNCTLPPGEYFIIPTSTGACFRIPDESIASNFLYYFKDWSRRVFRQFFAPKKAIGYLRFSRLVERINVSIEKSEFNEYCVKLSQKLQMTCDGFVEFMVNEYESKGQETVLGYALMLGFSENLNEKESRYARISVRSASDFQLLSMNNELSFNVWGLMAVKLGCKKKKIKGIEYYLFKHQKKYANTRIAYNTTELPQPISITYNILENYSLSGPCQHTVPPHSWILIHHLYMCDPTKPKKFSITFNKPSPS